MVSKNLAFKIAADDDATKVFRALAKAADVEFAKVQGSMDDTTSAGKKMAKGLELVAQQIESELAGVRASSDRLQAALGDGFDRGKVEGFVQDLRRAGLEFEEIDADVDELAASIRRLDDVRLGAVSGGMDNVTSAAKRTGDEVDRSRSVLANFAGNAVQDLPGVSGAFGALNVAAGQFAEYAAEGGIALQGFASALAPIAIGTVAVKTIADHFNRINETKAFNADQVDEWVDSLRDGGTVVEQIRDTALETGEIMARWGDQGAPKDLVPVLGALNIDLETYLALLEMSSAQLDEWTSASFGATRASLNREQTLSKESSGVSSLTYEQQQLLTLLDAVAQQQRNAAEAEERRATALQVLGNTMVYTGTDAADFAAQAEVLAQGINAVQASTEAVTPPLGTLGVAFGATAVAAGDAEAAAAKLAEQQEILEQRTRDATAAIFAQANSDLALRDAQDQVEASTAAYAEALKSADPEEISDATRQLEGDYLRLATAAGVAAADGLGPLASEADRADAANDAMVESLKSVAATLDPNGELYRWLTGYINKLNSIPLQITTYVSTRSGRTFTVPNTDVGGLPGLEFDDGGVVPGPIGSPQLVLAHGGEEFYPTHKPGFRPETTTVHNEFHFHGAVADKAQVVEWVHEGLLEVQRTTGDLGIRATSREW